MARVSSERASRFSSWRGNESRAICAGAENTLINDLESLLHGNVRTLPTSGRAVYHGWAIHMILREA